METYRYEIVPIPLRAEPLTFLSGKEKRRERREKARKQKH